MNIKIIQPAGFGDIFFCVKIGVRLVEMGHTVYWPVIPEYQYIEEYIQNGIIWREPGEGDENRIGFELDIGASTTHLRWRDGRELAENVMYSKYTYANKIFPDIGGYEDWDKYLIVTRNFDRERALESLVFRDAPEKFCVVCRHFATEYLGLDRYITSPNFPTLEVMKIPGHDLFSWLGIFEKASEIRIPDSSFPYLVEGLNTTDNLYLYSRNLEGTLRTHKVWKRPWTFIEGNNL